MHFDETRTEVSLPAAVGLPADGGVHLRAALVGAALGGVLHALVQAPEPGTSGLARSILLGTLLVPAAVADLRTARIPNTLTGGAAVAAGAILLVTGDPGFRDGLTGALAGGLLLLGVRFAGVLYFERPGMGMGDVKLATVLGLLLGPQILWALGLAIAAGGIAGAALLVAGRRARNHEMVFAPCIALGTVTAVYLLPFAWVWHHALNPYLY